MDKYQWMLPLLWVVLNGVTVWLAVKYRRAAKEYVKWSEGRMLPRLPSKDYFIWEMGQSPAHHLWYCTICCHHRKDANGVSRTWHSDECDTAADAVATAVDKIYQEAQEEVEAIVSKGETK